MKSLPEFDSLVGIILTHRLPRELPLFMNEDAYNQANDFLKTLGSGNIKSVKFVYGGEEKDLDIIKIHYGGCIFNIIKY